MIVGNEIDIEIPVEECLELQTGTLACNPADCKYFATIMQASTLSPACADMLFSSLKGPERPLCKSERLQLLLALGINSVIVPNPQVLGFKVPPPHSGPITLP